MSDGKFPVPSGQAAGEQRVPESNNYSAAPAAAPAPSRRRAKAPPAPAPRDGFREVVETIVFVVVLVLLLKAFVAEAFVIPTGSMATTLWGYQKIIDCKQCGYRFPVNCSDEGQRKSNEPVVGATCPNCGFEIGFPPESGGPVKGPSCNPGDRVLVAKYFYDTGLFSPKRGDVVVFKYPEAPQKDYEAMNYIKRLIGLPRETIGVRYGKLYVLPAGQGPHYDDGDVRPEDLWHKDYMHADDAAALALLEQTNSPFRIVRKPPAEVLALRRIVYDNDHPAEDLNFSRWAGDASTGGWAPDAANGFRHSGTTESPIDWLRYRNILRDSRDPELITDFLGYNSETTDPGRHTIPARNWVGDLMVECEATIEKPGGQLVLELSKGPDRFRARFDLEENGKCSLSRVTGKEETALGERPVSLTRSGAHALRFANVDDRLLVWVDGKLPFDDGVDYAPAAVHGPFPNDLQPASVGVEGGASVHVAHLKLWRDTYYTNAPGGDPSNADYYNVQPPEDLTPEQRDHWLEARTKLGGPDGWSDPASWAPLRNLPARTLYVQPGHYLCFGDNSPKSSDGRSWGLVPRRLLLGRALMVYYPFYIPFWSSVNRAGLIH